MTTRAAALSPLQVKALNAVLVEFYGKREIINLWRAYLDHLSQKPDAQGLRGQRRLDLFAALLHGMAVDLG
jgi:hypothetical protein